MDEIEELLPGIEEFLTITLASEQLSNFAEERRQFFIERLDIVKLPPTLPPREGRVLSPELLKETEETSGVPARHHIPDFAATQREISRSFVGSNPYTEDVTDGTDTSSDKGVKVYDDIDPTESAREETIIIKPRPLSDIKPNNTSDNDNEDIEDNALYEIPVARQQLSAESNSQSYGADGSSIAISGSTEELPDDVLDSTSTEPPPVPPPLPPRRDIKFSDSGSRNSINFEDKPPELPFRPPLPKRNELYTRSDKSDRSEKSNNSDPEMSGEGESTSYESFDEEEQQDTELTNKLNIQLPKKPPQKRMALKRSRKLSKSRSSSQWEISAPFRKLENIDISGELFYRGKLKWNRRIVAISNGCLAMYKPDKDMKPSLVIPLTGYEASVSEREGRKGFEVKMVHPNADSHSFSVDFKDWAVLWMEHINGSSKGQPPPTYHTHLARTFSGEADSGANATTFGSKQNITEDNSAELEYDEIDVAGEVTEDLFIQEEGDCDSIKSSPVMSLSNQFTRTLGARHFQSEKSPRHSKRRTLGHSPKSNPFGVSSKDRTISTTVKDILRRRQRAMYRIESLEPCVQTERYTPKGDRSGSHAEQVSNGEPMPHKSLPSAVLSLSRWDWKSVFYNWSMPLDQLILAFRRTDLTESNSNLSTGSEGGSEDSSKPKMKGNKVMRMGSFAFRATQFFENIGKKTTRKKSHQNSSPSFRHSGDFSDVHHGIVEEPSVPSSKSTGNLARSKRTTTSDSNLVSAISETESMFSLPHKSAAADIGKHWIDTDDDAFVDVAHKGYLSIFSSFNKRRWGKRWCLVRENMFECYKSDYSTQCELKFFLKPCVLRRAVVETNSENGLMIMEAGKEKITVEPLSKEEMGQWVRVLLVETSTQNVPEGLEEFMKEPKNSDGDGSSVMSFTVLKQWDMDCLVPAKKPSSHDYEDPTETTDAAAKFQAHNHTKSMTAFQSGAELNESSSCTVPKSIPISGDTGDKINNSLPVCKSKHTTDSGFYSAKGTNSDSDSSHEVGDLEFGYAVQDSRNFCNFQQSSTSNKDISLSTPGSEKESVLDKEFNHTATSVSHITEQNNEPTSSRVHVSHSSSSLSSLLLTAQKLPISVSESQLNTTGCTSDAQHRGSSQCNNNCCPVPPADLNLLKKHSNSVSTVNISGKPVSSSLTVLSPSGEEYSVVLKRSERSSRSLESCSELHNSLSLAPNVESKTKLDLQYDELNVDVSHSQDFSQEQSALNTSDTESSYYEPVCAFNSVHSNTVDRSPHLSSADQTTLGINSLHLPLTSFSSEDCDHPPPIPTSPIPDLVNLSPFSVKVTSLAAHNGNQEINTTLLPSYVLKKSVAQSLTRKDSDSYVSNMKTDNNVNTNMGDYAELSVSLEADTSDDVFLRCPDPLYPLPNDITSVVSNPNTTPAELKNMIECLKHKQSEIKRKRLAVHDKRHRVSSDEERLACEKEFAALVRAVEATEIDIRTVQNRLDILQGHTLETMKATQGKHKPGSKKKKMKKKF